MVEIIPQVPHTHNGSDSPKIPGDSVEYDIQSALLSSDTTLSNAVSRIGEIEVAMQNLGLLK